MGLSPRLAAEVFNCSAPDAGNIELPVLSGTAEQKERWLAPLLAGDIRSYFSLTEPEAASSDATNISTDIGHEGDSWVISSVKWRPTAVLRPDYAAPLVIGVADPCAEATRRQSIVLVPMDTPGLCVVRSASVLGFHGRHERGHGEIEFSGVPVRLIGMAERAIALIVARARTRAEFAVPLIEQGAVQTWIADARTSIKAGRLLVLAAAHAGAEGAKAARHDIAAAKVFVWPRPRRSSTIPSRYRRQGPVSGHAAGDAVRPRTLPSDS